MKISYHKINFEMDFKFPENLEEINNHINSVWRNLPSLTITSDQNLLDETINITQEFAKNKNDSLFLGQVVPILEQEHLSIFHLKS